MVRLLTLRLRRLREWLSRRAYTHTRLALRRGFLLQLEWRHPARGCQALRSVSLIARCCGAPPRFRQTHRYQLLPPVQRGEAQRLR